MQVPPSPELATSAQEAVQSWSPLSSHPNLLVPRASFITGELEGGPALVFAHAFHPTAVTLDQAHLQPTSGWLPSIPLWISPHLSHMYVPHLPCLKVSRGL